MSVWPALEPRLRPPGNPLLQETQRNVERQLNVQNPSQTACYKSLWTKLKIRNGDAQTKN